MTRKIAKIDNIPGESAEWIQHQIDSLNYGYQLLSSEERKTVFFQLKELYRRKHILKNK